MKVLVWIVSSLAALAFLAIGSTKLLTPTDVMADGSMGIPVILLRIAGAAEVIGAFGLILPAATRIMPILTPVAAIGLCVVMVGAITANIIVGAYAGIAVPVVLLVFAALVAWLRFGPYPVQPRTGGGVPAPAQAA